MEEQANERPIVEIIERGDYKAYRKFYYFMMRRHLMAWFAWIPLCGLAPIVLITVIHSFFVAHTNNATSLVMFVLFTVAIAFNAYLPRITFKRNWGQHQLEVKTSFFEERFDYVSTGQNTGTSASIRYERIAKVYDTESAFYLKYAEKNWGYIPKSCMALEQADALRALFALVLKDKFKQQKHFNHK